MKLKIKKGSMPDIMARMSRIKQATMPSGGRGEASPGRSLKSTPRRKKATLKHLKGGTDDTIISKLRGGYGAARPNFGKTAKRRPIKAIRAG